jgi:hypothetical protein
LRNWLNDNPRQGTNQTPSQKTIGRDKRIGTYVMLLLLELNHIAFFAFIACATAGSAHLQAISGRDLQVNPGIAVQLQSVELLY